MMGQSKLQPGYLFKVCFGMLHKNNTYFPNTLLFK